MHPIAPRSFRSKCKWFMLDQHGGPGVKWSGWCLEEETEALLVFLVTNHPSSYLPSTTSSSSSPSCWESQRKSRKCHSSRKRRLLITVWTLRLLSHQRLIHPLDKARLADWTSHSKAVWVKVQDEYVSVLSRIKMLQRICLNVIVFKDSSIFLHVLRNVQLIRRNYRFDKNINCSRPQQWIFS